MVKLRERFSVLSIILIGFLMGAMFVSGGVVAYKLFFPSPVVAENSVTTAAQVSLGPTSIAQTVKQVSPAVVNIESISEQTEAVSPFANDPLFGQFFGHYNASPQTETAQAIGTGFIFDKSGLILTNEHVIDGASKINVTISGYSKPVQAKVVGSDSDLDLAVLKVSVNKDLPVLKLGNSNNTEVGSWVIAIGNPYGLDHTVTVGVISAKSRPVTISDRQYKNLLQTDAAINPGNSGGPLLNTNGEVIGINTAVNASAQGIGFAIPIDTAKDVLNDLVNKGKVVKSYIGVYLQPLDQELAQYFGVDNTDGVLVAQVQPGAPAQKAGIQKGDIITSVNNTKVTSPDDLTSIVQKTKIGQNLVFKILRNQKTMNLTVKTVEKP